jgi:Protein of unknown function (DUF3168)
MTENDIRQALDAALPGRAFLMLAPQGFAEPYLIFQRIWFGAENSLCGYAEGDHVRYQVDSYARTRAEAKTNMDAALASLRSSSDPPNVENGGDLYEQDTKLHRITVSVITWYDPQGATP